MDARRRGAYSPAMLRPCHLIGALCAGALLLPVPAMAQAPARPPPAPAAGPRPIGTFGAWTAALHTENGARVCYMLARANRETNPARAPTLTVTHRTGLRDQVALQGEGLCFQRNAAGTLKVGETDLPLTTHGDTAYARDNRAAIAALRGGRDAVARLPGPNGRGTTSETFPLNGFSAAYDAIARECPAPRR